MDKPRNMDIPLSSKQGGGERVDINLGHACNHKCLFCMQSNSSAAQRRWVPLEKLKGELRFYAQEHGLHSLGLLGGEPTLYPWFTETLETARDLGFNDITLNTNGYRLGDWEFAKRAAELGVNRYCLSIHSEVPSIEDYLSNSKGAFIRKLRAIRNLIRLRKDGVCKTVISINAVLNQKNLPTLPRFVRFFRQLGISDIRFNYIRPEGRAKDKQDLVPRYHEAIPQILDLIDLNEREFKIRLTFGEIPYCAFPPDFFNDLDKRHRYIGEYTDIRTFVSSFGNPTDRLTDEEGTQRFIWQDLKKEELKSLTTACKSCLWLPICGGVWSNYLEIYGESEFSAITEEK